MPLPSHTVIRETDVAIETSSDRLGTSGSNFLNDFTSRVHNAFGFPLELKQRNPAGSILDYSGGYYTLPNGQRVSGLFNKQDAVINDGYIDFQTGTISTGNNMSFSLPTMTAGNWIKAIVEYSAETISLNVVFGTQSSWLFTASIPQVSYNYSPLYLLELKSTAGGVGNWDPITNSSIIKITPFIPSPKKEGVKIIEIFDTTAPETVFITATQFPFDEKRISVFYNGIKMVNGFSDDYIISGTNQITFNYTIPASSRIVIELD